MEEEKNKIKNICKLLIHDKKNFIKLLFDCKDKYKIIDKIDYKRNKLEDFYIYFSSIKYNNLNDFCCGSNFPRYEYFFHYYFNKTYYNTKLFNNINSSNINYYLMDNTSYELNYILFCILFSSDEEIYNKSFKDKLNIDRKKLINMIFYRIIYSNSGYKRYGINRIYKLLLKLFDTSNFYNMTFQGIFFLNFKNMIYNLIFSNDYKEWHKKALLHTLRIFFSMLLNAIDFLLYLPLEICTNNKYFKYKNHICKRKKYCILGSYYLDIIYNNNNFEIK